MKKFSIAVSVVGLFVLVSPARATIIGTYVDADLSNTTPGTAITTTVHSATDNMWEFQSNSSSIGNSSGSGFLEAVNQSAFLAFGHSENPSDMTTTVSGLNPANAYDVYVVYGAQAGIDINSNPFDYGVGAALSGNSLVTYDTTNGTHVGSDSNSSDVWQYEALLGVASGVSSFAVDINNPSSLTRSYYDGVAYSLVTPEPGSLVLLAFGALGLAGWGWKRKRR